VALELVEKIGDSALLARARAAGLARLIVVPARGAGRWRSADGTGGGAIPAARLKRALAGAIGLDALLGTR
jgi:hypothetical protein